jgi:3-isopropylmalate dehydrogenase
MMLRHSFALPAEAEAVERAVASAIADGVLTGDIAAAGGVAASGTVAAGDAVVRQILA